MGSIQMGKINLPLGNHKALMGKKIMWPRASLHTQKNEIKQPIKAKQNCSFYFISFFLMFLHERVLNFLF
jgi:hypothetical protein